MQVAARGGGVGKRGAVVQQQDQLGALAEVGCGRSSTDEASGLGEELVGETGARAWGRSRHATAPGASDQVF